jgi:hypothetical protein
LTVRLPIAVYLSRVHGWDFTVVDDMPGRIVTLIGQLTAGRFPVIL